jgi:hypothetical protein
MGILTKEQSQILELLDINSQLIEVKNLLIKELQETIKIQSEHIEALKYLIEKGNRFKSLL